MSEVILIYPNTGWSVTGLSVELPLSVLSVASTLVQDYDVKIIDQRTDSDWKDTLKDAMRSDTICVGISSMTGPQVRAGLEVSRFIKETAGKDVPVVWGGVQPTLIPSKTSCKLLARRLNIR